MAFKSPLETIKAVQVTGTAKTLMPWDKLLLMGFLAGAYIAFGSLLALIVTAGMTKAGYPIGLYRFAFGAVFPVGLMLVAVSYTHLRAHETDSYLVCRLLLEKKKNTKNC